MANFTGSVTQLGPEYWRLRVYVGRTAKGSPIQRSRQFRGTRKQASKALAAFVVELEGDEGARTAEAGTLNALLDRWIGFIEPDRSVLTIRDYRSKVRLYIAPTIGKMALAKLGPAHLDGLYAGLRARGLSTATIVKTHAILSAALAQGVNWGWLTRSPADTASPPSINRDGWREALSAEALRQIIEAAVAEEGRGGVLPVGITLAALTGCRRGELCALRWTDLATIDATGSGILTVRRGLAVVNRVWKETTTKTKRGRLVPLDARALAVLDWRREAQEAYAAEVGVKLAQDAFILSRAADGSQPCLPDGLSHGFTRLVERLWPRERDDHGDYTAPPKWHEHDLRHFAASIGVGSGMVAVAMAASPRRLRPGGFAPAASHFPGHPVETRYPAPSYAVEKANGCASEP
ncbi:MAG TPA: site-specific integrase [Acidimicrobiales bacterium]|nr:site-specific integrase [Acidimicrobiales bacterium]